MDNSKDLIEIVLDVTASDAERDDAAIDLGFVSNDPSVQAALLTIANDKDTDEMIRASCGESLAQIWMKNNEFDLNNLSRLAGIAHVEALECFERENSDE